MKYHVNEKRAIGKRSPMLYGHFIEHFHRQIYDGIYDPGNKLSDEEGFRKDIIEAMKKIKVPVLRWPGGCFVSSYHWKDGVGENRQPFFDKAWRVEDPNTFGTDEYIHMCRKIGCEPYICTNAGTGTAEEMSDWVEYCNLKNEGKYAKWRIANGEEQPYNVKYWSIGNENYGNWEIGAKSSEEWWRLVKEAAKMIKHVSPIVQLSAAALPDIDWTMSLLKHCGAYLDWISLHGYWDMLPEKNELADYNQCMAYTEQVDRAVLDVKGLLTALHLEGKIKIAFDEWNVWFHTREADDEFMEKDPWHIAPPLLEDQYSFEDALLVGLMLITLMKHADRVKMACLAQLVNVIAPIMTEKDGGKAWRQTIFYPFMHASRYGRGMVLQPVIDTPVHDTKEHENVTDLSSVAVWNEADEELTVFAVNRNIDEDMELVTDLRSMEGYQLIEHIVLENNDMKACNSASGEAVIPITVSRSKVDGGIMTSVLNKASWNVIRLKKQK